MGEVHDCEYKRRLNQSLFHLNKIKSLYRSTSSLKRSHPELLSSDYYENTMLQMWFEFENARREIEIIMKEF